MEGGPRRLELLTRIALLAPLPPTTLEKLAARARVAPLAAGEMVMAEGDAADDFYAIADGSVSITRAGRHLNSLGPGDAFGEIALLGDSARTATVVTTSPTRFVVIDGRQFVDALSSSETAFSIGSRIADERLASDAAS